MTNAQDARNRTTWSRASARKWLDAYGTITDPGERIAFDLVRDQVRGKPILDLGVGAGRTIPFLAPLSEDYLAIDYLPEMVEACRARYPMVKVEVGDARDLKGVPSAHFGLVCFTFNGIDAVDHEGRARVLAEMHRVVKPDGIVMFSTLNLDGPAFRDRPWAPRPATGDSTLRRVVRNAKTLMSVPLDVARWARLQKDITSGPGWAVAPLSAHHYGVLVHFTTLARQLEELAETKLDRDLKIIENENGTALRPGDDTSSSAWFHFIASPR